MHKYGISSSGGDQDLIGLAHDICTLLGAGYSTNALVANGALHALNMSTDDERFLVQTSEAAYCPQYIN